MSGATASPQLIPYMTDDDDLASLDEFTNQLATRVHALFRGIQGGSTTITPSAVNTQTTKRVNFPTSYLANPDVVVCLGEGITTPGAITLWVTGIDTTGFTLGITSATTAARTVRWMAIDKST